ncbi:MAG: ribonuclease III [Lachnospiraceae bacterium]|nr:ribonuclease III [Lachnospiraceae bacterium]
MASIEELQSVIDYKFKDKSLIVKALTHSSYANEMHMGKLHDNERLEFLGDAVLEIVTSRFLYLNYPSYAEGDLTKLRASLVCEPTLAYCTKAIDLGKYIMLAHGEEKCGGRNRNSILSDAFEALIGAIYLDGGLDKATEFIEKYVLTDIDSKTMFHDCKTNLQELVQAKHDGNVEYKLISEEGPAHNKVFESVVVYHEKILGKGTGHSKKAAEQEAAYQALLNIKEDNICI